MPRLKVAARQRAIEHGLEFIYRFSCKRDNFADHGSDLLCCFQLIGSTARDGKIRRMAFRFGQERARQWRIQRPHLPDDADANTIVDFMLGTDAADRLGLCDPKIKTQLQNLIRNFPVDHYLRFNPVREPPPDNIPDQCDCGSHNRRGRKTCRECKSSLTILTRYKVWYDALTRVYSATYYGVNLGATTEDFIKWLPFLRPYRGREDDTNPDFFDTVYAITHLVYALNDYNVFRLSPRVLPQEFAFLKANLREAIEMQDGEMLGEFVDSLMAFGLTDSHPLIRLGRDYLLNNQNSDGSWGETNLDAYTRYHSTWTAIDGLRDFDWQVNAKPTRLRRLIARLPRAT